jgi:hypothetical protein
MKERLGDNHYRAAAMDRLRPRTGDLRAHVAFLGVFATCILAALSAGLKYDVIWDHLTSERRGDEALTPQERERAPLAAIPLAAEIFDYYAAFLRPGDRVYFHVLESGFSDFADLPTLVATAGRFWLLPAVQVTNLEDATVVVSWERDPGELGIEFSEQHRAGQQLFFVSRIAR